MEENNKNQTSDPVDAEGASEAPADFEVRSEFLPLIDRMQAEEPVEPQPDFTLRVMADIERQSAKTDAAEALRRLRSRAASLLRYATETPTIADIALCFLLAGFFYFVLGVIFFFGLKSIEPLPAMAGWLRMQPQIAMLTAGVLGTLGLLLLLDGGIAMHLAQIGTIIFIVFSVFNGMWFNLTNTSPYSSFGLLCFTAAPVLLGLFLSASLQRYRRRVLAG